MTRQSILVTFEPDAAGPAQASGPSEWHLFRSARACRGPGVMPPEALDKSGPNGEGRVNLSDRTRVTCPMEADN